MKVYLVGGAIRDRLLSLPIHERDWVVVGAKPEELTAQGYRQVGKDFPVFIHPESGEEYALARTERKTAKGHQGFSVHSSPSVTLKDDLTRRDLTINAIAEDSEGKLIDHHDGLKDLRNKVLRHVSPAFSEDPLRVLRVARFAARFWKYGFTIAPETLHLMQTINDSGELAYLSKERVWNETQKALLTDNPEIFFLATWQTGALEQFASPLADALQINQNLLRLADIRQLKGLDARYIGVSMVAAYNDHQIDTAIVGQLNELFGANKSLQEMAILNADHFHTCTQALSLSEQEIYQTLSRIDAFRRPDRCIKLLQCIKQIQQAFRLGSTDSVEFLIESITELNDIKPDNKIKVLSGEEIGAALAELRMKKLKEIKLDKCK
ncbi:MAG: multifunctional CCA tRNA nucleotidyl transferase/2'3'-cyclic phosphodiesterase/2'nucleotidase/phosphatase [Pseudomonadota bacterium]